MISEITLKEVKEYCGVDDDYSDSVLTTCMSSAKSFISSYTGVENLDEIPAFDIAYLVLINTMYLNREAFVDKGNLDPIVSNILSMHSVNLV